MNFVKNGFSGNNPNFYMDSTASTNPGIIDIPLHSPAFPTGYTDDSATIMKVNTATDAFTTLNATFAGVASTLFTNFENSNNADVGLPIKNNATESSVAD
jgi:hypothetical protein